MGRQPKHADDSFLPGMKVEEIKDLYDAEQDKRNAQKLQVAYHYKSGKSVREAADAACTNYENARRWILGMRQNGPDALRHRKPPGAARMLTRDERVRLVLDVHKGPRACGFETNVWTYALIHRHVRKKFKVEIGYRAVVYLLHKLRIVIKSARSAHPLEASPEERAEFRRETRKSILTYARRGYLLLFLDEVYPQSYKNTRKTVGIKGGKTIVPASVETATLPLIGVLGDGFYYLMEVDRANTATFIKCCKRIFCLFGPVQFVLDHAGYHKSKKFNKFAEEYRRYLQRHFTLKYTPGDNSVEGLWKYVKAALSNMSLRSRGHMCETLGKAVRAGEVPPVAIFRYGKVGTRRLSPREARAIASKIGDGEHFYYEKTDPPGRIRLPTADDVKAKKKVLSPEMRRRLPLRLANSDLPYEYLADPPELLLKE